MNETPYGWLVAIFTTGMAALSGAVSILWKKQCKDQDDQIKELREQRVLDRAENKAAIEIIRIASEQCQKDRMEQAIEIEVMKRSICDMQENKANRKTVERKIEELKQ